MVKSYTKRSNQHMRDFSKQEAFFSALASAVRLEILDCISKEIANPGEIAEKLDSHRSSVEKHLKILANAGIIEKKPSLNQKGQLSIRYALKIDLSEVFSMYERLSRTTAEKL